MEPLEVGVVVTEGFGKIGLLKAVDIRGLLLE